MTGQQVTITSGKRGVGNTAATVKLGVALAPPGRNGARPGSAIGLRNLGVILGRRNRGRYDLADGVEAHARPDQAPVTDQRLVADLSLGPATRRRRLN